jgi:ElaB/YqjD/DUF883 family membrane-anchored ribosome-binding protein
MSNVSRVSKMPVKGASAKDLKGTRRSAVALNEAADGMSNMLHDLAGVAREWVRENPTRAVAIAVGAGVFYGLLRSRRR